MLQSGRRILLSNNGTTRLFIGNRSWRQDNRLARYRKLGSAPDANSRPMPAGEKHNEVPCPIRTALTTLAKSSVITLSWATYAVRNPATAPVKSLFIACRLSLTSSTPQKELVELHDLSELSPLVEDLSNGGRHISGGADFVFAGVGDYLRRRFRRSSRACRLDLPPPSGSRIPSSRRDAVAKLFGRLFTPLRNETFLNRPKSRLRRGI